MSLNEGGSKKEGNGKRSERIVKRAVRSLFGRLGGRNRRAYTRIPPLEAGSLKKIIVIRQHNQFGDVLCTVPLLRALVTKFNPEELVVVVSPQNIDALANCPYATSLINYDKLAFYRSPSLFLDFLKKLRKGYDVLLVPSNVSLSLTNDIMAFFVNAKMKIGPLSLESSSNKTSSVYDVAVDLAWGSTPVHQSFRNMKVASPLGIQKGSDDGRLEYVVEPSMVEEARNLIAKLGNETRRKVALHAGAGKVPNRWDVRNFAALSDLLHDELDAEIFLTEGPMDHEAIDVLAGMIKGPFLRVRNKAITFVAALLKQMDLVITNDTGIMHLAAAVGAPTLSLFGPTDPLQWAPLGKWNRFVLGRHGDINTISVDKVFSLAKKAFQFNQDKDGLF